MKKYLVDTKQIILDLDDITPFKEEFLDKEGKKQERDVTLKDVILPALRQANLFGLSSQEEDRAFELGILLFKNDGVMKINTEQWDTLRTVVSSKQKSPDGKSYPFYANNILPQRAKQLIEKAEIIEED